MVRDCLKRVEKALIDDTLFRQCATVVVVETFALRESIQQCIARCYVPASTRGSVSHVCESAEVERRTVLCKEVSVSDWNKWCTLSSQRDVK